MAKKKITLEIEFERTDDTSKRLPTRADMTQWVLAALSVPARFCVRFVGQEEGLELNKTYRGKDYATNVLTFDYQHRDLHAGLGARNKGTEQNFQISPCPPFGAFNLACSRLGSRDR